MLTYQFRQQHMIIIKTIALHLLYFVKNSRDKSQNKSNGRKKYKKIASKTQKIYIQIQTCFTHEIYDEPKNMGYHLISKLLNL